MSAKQTKEQLSKLTTAELEKRLWREANIAILYFFGGGNTGPEAKLACVAGIMHTRKIAAENNKESLRIIAERILQEGREQKRLGEELKDEH